MASGSNPADKKKTNRDAYTLHTFPQPLFLLEELDDMHLLVGGGGGSSRTGILNQLHIAQITPPVSSTGVPYGIKLLAAIDTGAAAAMSASTAEFFQQSPQERAHLMRQFQDSLPRLQQAAGTSNNNNQLLGSCRSIVESCSKLLAISQGGSTALYFVTKGMTSNADGSGAEQQPTWFVTHVANVHTDETPDDPYQRVVKICRITDQSASKSSRSSSTLSDFFFFTGGADGSVKGFVLFAVDALNPKQSIKIDPAWIRGQLHKEVISLSVSSDSACVASCGREGRAFILSSSDGSLLKEIPVACVPNESNAPTDANSAAVERRYLCCAVRFNPAQPRELFVAWIPANKYQRKMPSYIMRLRLMAPSPAADTAKSSDAEQKYQLQIDCTKSLGTNPVHIDGLEVSRDGQLLAVSLIGGNVLQLDANTLNTRSTSRAPHDAPVNRFLYANNMIVGENTLMSVGIDNKLVLHKPARSSVLSVNRFLLTWLIASIVLYLGFHMLTTYKGLPTSSRSRSASSRFASFVPSRSINVDQAADLLNDTTTSLPPAAEKQHHRKHLLHRHDDHHDHAHDHSHDAHTHDFSSDAPATAGAPPVMAIPRVDLPHSVPEYTEDYNNAPQPSISVTPTLSASIPPLAVPQQASLSMQTAAPSMVAVTDSGTQLSLPTASEHVQQQNTAAVQQPIDAAKTLQTTAGGHVHDHHHHHHGDGHDHSHDDHHHDHDHDHGHGHGHGHDHHHHHHHDKKKEYEASFAQFQQHRPAPATMIKQPAAASQTATRAGGLFGMLRAPKITAVTSATVTTGSAAPLQPTVVSSVHEVPASQSVIISTTAITSSSETPASMSVEATTSAVLSTDAVITPKSTTEAAPAIKDHADESTFESAISASENVTETVQLESPPEIAPTATEAPEPSSTTADTITASSLADTEPKEPADLSVEAKTTVVDTAVSENIFVVVENAAPLKSTLSDADTTTPTPEAASVLDAAANATTELVNSVAADNATSKLHKTTDPELSTANEQAVGQTTSTHAPDRQPTTAPTGGDIDASPPAVSLPMSLEEENVGQNLSEPTEKTDADIFDTFDSEPDAEEDELEVPVEKPEHSVNVENLPPIPLPTVAPSTEAVDAASSSPASAGADAEPNSATNQVFDLNDMVNAVHADNEAPVAKRDDIAGAEPQQQTQDAKPPAEKKSIFSNFLDMV